jgi:hypothetical protein
MSERPQNNRFDHLSRSTSGLHYVRDRNAGGVMRVLSDSELADFDDPPPCPQCAEQFGCEHYNCAGEPLLTEAEIEMTVPAEWRQFAKDYGVSSADLDRLVRIECREGEYRLRFSVETDMRTNELVLLLNESR